MHIACQLHDLAWPNLAYSELQPTGTWIAVEFARLRADNGSREEYEDDGPHAAEGHTERCQAGATGTKLFGLERRTRYPTSF
jgi:hypothetical protein